MKVQTKKMGFFAFLMMFNFLWGLVFGTMHR